MPKVLFIAAHRPDRSPSQRYRFEQFVPYWERHGFSFHYAWLIDAEDDRRFYSPGQLSAKARIFMKSWKRRQEHVRMAKDFDLVMVQREAFMTGSTRFERALAATGVPLIYDFDDAIWHMDVSEGNRKLRWLKDPGKTARIIRLADLVIAGNAFLADHAKKYSTRVETIPTVIDTDRYRPTAKISTGPVVIGWTGSHTSMAHLKQVLPMLKAVYAEWGDRIRFRVISDRDFDGEGLPVENIRWSSATEAEDLAAIDIGIMPLPNDVWSRGKCGFKGLQYMAMAKAVVLSRVGVNPSIVQEGVNGLLAGDQDEWLLKLGQLIADPDLRQRIGQAARTTVEEHYSVRSWRDRYLELFSDLQKGTSASGPKGRNA
ncbi:MAG: glycosyltransferase family 4 protein [Flavobacteriales bacterium]|nr:glycosyltransferase family 4 protein [Flavobacteriales bacterium]